MMEESMRKEGREPRQVCGKSAIPPDEIMVSALVSKVNNPSHLADFGAQLRTNSSWRPTGIGETSPPHAPAESHPA